MHLTRLHTRLHGLVGLSELDAFVAVIGFEYAHLAAASCICVLVYLSLCVGCNMCSVLLPSMSSLFCILLS